jgi:hypothetical protein
MYPQLDDPEFIPKLLTKKEFYSLKSDERDYKNPPNPINDLLSRKYMNINSYQLLVGNFLNPNTPYNRLHLTHTTGTGKTIGALFIANGFLQAYRNGVRGTVFVFGFGGTKAAFIRDLLKYPEFGFVTVWEKAELEKRRVDAQSGVEYDIKRYTEYYIMLKKRITNKAKGGHFKFYGYDEFVNRLFQSDTINLIELENEAIKSEKSLVDIVRAHISRGEIRVNKTLVDLFENSLIICDEIHNTYNSVTKNNRGVAIQYILDSVRTVRFVSLSATPINNSPSELVEWLNYLSPVHMKKTDLFENSRTLLPGALEKISELMFGRVSFLQDFRPKYFPVREFTGSEVKIPYAVDELPGVRTIPYLKFIECPMSKMHQNTHVTYMREVRNEDSRIPTDGYAIYDIVFPTPASDVVGSFRSSDIKQQIMSAPDDWKKKVGVDVKPQSEGIDVIVGSFLQAENIGKYSSKFAELLRRLTDMLRNNPREKIMVYHDRVKTSGVLLIQELLKANGFLDEVTDPTENTLCNVCGSMMKDHGRTVKTQTAPSAPSASAHEFTPARFVIAHSDIDKSVMMKSLDKFNSQENVYGDNYRILIGSKIIKESYDFKAIQNLIITSMPTNIPTFLQVIGRSVRKNSHIDLPVENRRVKIYILITQVNREFDYDDEISPEMRRYIAKISDYITIQKIERAINESAFDGDINRSINMPDDLLEQYKRDGDQLGNLYFDQKHRVHTDNPTVSTWYANKYYESEIKQIIFIIKRLYTLSPVYTYAQLLELVHNPPISVEVNPRFFSDDSFIIALDFLASDGTKLLTKNPHDTGDIITRNLDSLFDRNDRFIYVGTNRLKIVQVGAYYVAFPIVSTEDSTVSTQWDAKKIYRDKEKQLLVTLSEQKSKPIVDVEMYMRKNIPKVGITMSVNKFIIDSTLKSNFASDRSKFYSDHGGKTGIDFLQALLHMPDRFQISLLEDAITSTDITLPTDKVIDAYKSLDAVVTGAELSKYKDVVSLFKGDVSSHNVASDGVASDGVASDGVVGYTTNTIVRLYDPAQGWIETSKVSINRQSIYKENEIIIGFMETFGSESKLKVRQPIHKIKRSKDNRTIERGSVCTTRSKEELFKLARNLGISISKTRVKNICDAIEENLLQSEIKARAAHNRYKYLYGWWDDMPQI